MVVLTTAGRTCVVAGLVAGGCVAGAFVANGWVLGGLVCGGTVAEGTGFATKAFRLTPGGSSNLSMAWNTPVVVNTSAPVTVASLMTTLLFPTTTFSALPSRDFRSEVVNWRSVIAWGITLYRTIRARIALFAGDLRPARTSPESDENALSVGARTVVGLSVWTSSRSPAASIMARNEEKVDERSAVVKTSLLSAPVVVMGGAGDAAGAVAPGDAVTTGAWAACVVGDEAAEAVDGGTID